MSTETRIAWSTDEENFIFDDKIDAVRSMLDQDQRDVIGRSIFFGDVVEIDPAKYVDADDVINDIANRAYDEGGEWAEDYPDVTPEAKQALGDFLTAWAREHCKPHFYLIENTQHHIITEEDIKEAQA